MIHPVGRQPLYLYSTSCFKCLKYYDFQLENETDIETSQRRVIFGEIPQTKLRWFLFFIMLVWGKKWLKAINWFQLSLELSLTSFCSKLSICDRTCRHLKYWCFTNIVYWMCKIFGAYQIYYRPPKTNTQFGWILCKNIRYFYEYTTYFKIIKSTVEVLWMNTLPAISIVISLNLRIMGNEKI